MKQNLTQKSMWNTAAQAGLILGLISTAYMFITQWTGKSEMPSFLTMIINAVFWCAKFGGCIWAMRFFMKKFAGETENVTNSMTFKCGMIMALLSALVFSAFSFANVAFISADFYAEQIESTMQSMAPMLDSNTLAQVDKTLESLPQITFFSNMLYCFVYGTILSAILSRNIPSKDPFASYKPDEQ